jgi:hypothetical protein
VLADGEVLGRILERRLARRAAGIAVGMVDHAIVPATPGVTDGTAATHEEAMAKFREAWEKANAEGRA